MTLEFEGRRIRLEPDDTVASALFRAGVRTFTRSLKHHRRRGLYCLTGDCANCLLTVDGRPGVRSCVTEARDGMRVCRETGWPSTERDLLAVTGRLRPLMPVAFYSKTFIRPRFAWSLAERVIRRATGVGRLPLGEPPARKPARNAHTQVLVIGAGPAGLAAAIAAADGGSSVVLCDEAMIGDKLPLGPTLERVRALASQVRRRRNVTILEGHTAVGVYDGPFVPLAGSDETVHVHPERVVVATGAVELHPVFRDNDLPGVWLGRGATRMAAVHGVPIGDPVVVVAGSAEGLEHVRALVASGTNVTAVVLGDAELDAPDVPIVVRGGTLVAAEGRRHVGAAVLDAAGGRRRIPCEALVVSLGSVPRDGLLRMAADLPVVGAGEVVRPGCTPGEAVESGTAAGAGDRPEPASAPLPVAGKAGYVCVCEDVSLHDLEAAWREGWRSSEILKRYTTATMGPCQGALCGRHLSAFVARATGREDGPAALTTARPPARPVALEDLAAGVHEVIEKRTALHDRHLELGGHVQWSGSWKRPYTYGDTAEEYRAVRERVSVMDVSTLGKFLVAGQGALELLDRTFPCRIRDLAPGRSRYLLALDEAGYVMDDGLVCALDDERYALTSTSGGADRMEAWLRNWVDRLGLHVHLVNETAMLGAINLAGPRARDVLSRLTDDAVDKESFPHMAVRKIEVAGVRCRALRVGFVGELSFELHHPRSQGVQLWDALLDAGVELGIRPHGLDALELLRLEKGHVYLGQDTLPDDHPAKLGLSWAVDTTKEDFVGRTALARMAEVPLERKLVGLTFDSLPSRGGPLVAGDRVVGRITSCARSEALGAAIGLGWVRPVDGVFPTELRAGAATATVVPTPFYDPEGTRLRA